MTYKKMDSKEEVRQKIDIVDLIGQSVQLKQAGRNLKGLCPFHDEKTPSFMVSPERQSYKCFGCGEGGDIFSFYMKREGVSFPEALKDLAKQAGVELTSYQSPQDWQHKERLMALHHDAAKYYHYLLTKHQVGEKAREYLKQRQITNMQVNNFQLGYAMNGWSGLTDYLIKKKNYKPQELVQAGVGIEGSRGVYDRFRGRLMFPLYDVRHNLVGFSGRILPEYDDGKSGKYINSPETKIYYKSQMLFGLSINKDYIRKAGHVVVVEGELDVLASMRANVRSVVAVKGSALTTEQVKLLKRFCETIILSLDSDQAGIKAAKRAIEVARGLAVQVRVVELIGGKDPDELVKTDPGAWRELIKGAVNAYDFLINVAVKDKDLTTATAAQQVTNELIPLLLTIDNQVLLEHFVKKVAKLLAVDIDVIKQEMQRQQKTKQLPQVHQQEQSKSVDVGKNREQLLAESLLALVIQYYQDIDWQLFDVEDLPSVAQTQIVEMISKEHPQDIITFAKTLPEQLQSSFDEAFLQEVESLDKTGLNKQLRHVFLELAKLHLRDRLRNLRQQLKTASDTDNITQQITAIMKKLQEYNK